jgi:hypothetical protein
MLVQTLQGRKSQELAMVEREARHFMAHIFYLSEVKQCIPILSPFL